MALPAPNPTLIYKGFSDRLGAKPSKSGKTSGAARLSAALSLFQSQTDAEHAYQLGFDLDYVERDCFEHKNPLIVPACVFRLIVNADSGSS